MFLLSLQITHQGNTKLESIIGLFHPLLNPEKNLRNPSKCPFRQELTLCLLTLTDSHRKYFRQIALLPKNKNYISEKYLSLYYFMNQHT